MPGTIPDLGDVLAGDVEGDVAKRVNVENRGADLVGAELGLRQIEPHERVRVDRRAELLDRDAAGEVRRGRSEEVAAVEGARDRLERVLRVRELVRRRDPRPLGRGDQQAVVRADEEPALLVAQRERAARAADARVDDGEMDADGHVGERAREHERALQDLLPRDPVRDVDDLRLGRDPLDHAVARADEVVLEPEVAQEADEHAAEPIAASRPATSCVSASRTTSTPASRAAAVVCGPMLTAGMPDTEPCEGPRSGGRGQDDEVPVGRLRRRQLARAVQRRRTSPRARRRAAASLLRPRRRAPCPPAAAAPRAVPPASRPPGRGRRRRRRRRSPGRSRRRAAACRSSGAAARGRR